VLSYARDDFMFFSELRVLFWLQVNVSLIEFSDSLRCGSKRN
jgi:hypothetical protein